MPKDKNTRITSTLDPVPAIELDWFSLSRYESLSKFNYAQWRDLVFSRIELDRITRLNTEDVLLRIVKQLKEDPLSDFGYQFLHTDTDNPASTASVKQIRTDQIHDISNRLKKIGASRDMTVDEAFAECNKSPNNDPLAHLAIRLDATNAQIIDDFKKWLLAWREYTGKVTNKNYELALGDWVTDRVVPYFDLTLVARIQGDTIHQDVMREILYKDHNDDKWDKTKRNVPPSVANVFSKATLAMLFYLSR